MTYMKKIVMTMAVALLVSTGAMAQDVKNPERKQLTKAEMIQHRTDRMVKTYQLSEEQAAKLLELNNQYADVTAGPRRGGNGPRPDFRRPDGKPQEQMPDSLKKKGPRGEKMGGMPNFEEMKKKMDEYDAKLQAIMTPEQYAAYKADREKMMQRGPRRGNPQHRNQ